MTTRQKIARAEALSLIDELRSAGRISSVEARALRDAIGGKAPPDTTPAPTNDPSPLEGPLAALSRAVAFFGDQAKLAAAVGTSQGHLSRVLNGKHALAAELAVAVERATEGEVMRSEMRPDLWPPA